MPSNLKKVVSAVALMIGLVPVTSVAQQPTPTVAAITAQAKDFTQTIRLPGRVKASTIAEVRPQVSGIIEKRLFVEGASVAVGEPLYQIDNAVYRAAVAAAQAAVSQAQANYDLAVLEAERASRLLATNTGSAANRDKAIASQSAADAALQMAKAQLSSAKIDLDRTTIRASVAGVIGLSKTTTGALVSAQQADALTTIRTLDPIYVDLTLSANDLLNWNASPQQREAMMHVATTLFLPNGQIFGQKGEVRAAEPQVEPTTGMVTLRVSFPNPRHELLPGLYVEVEMPISVSKDAVLVPQNAVMRDASGQASVWIVEDGKIAVRQLNIVTSDGNRWVTTGGLKGGELIVVSGFQKAAPGAQVQVESAEQKPEATPREGN